MWPAIICGLILYKLFKCFFYDDDVLDIEASDSTVLFSLSNRFQFSASRFHFCFFYFQFYVLLMDQISKIWIFFCYRLQKLFGGKVFVGLRIPDADSASPQTIDLVLLTKRYFIFRYYYSLFMFYTFTHVQCGSN
jgi:hypothetical protein